MKNTLLALLAVTTMSLTACQVDDGGGATKVQSVDEGNPTTVVTVTADAEPGDPETVTVTETATPEPPPGNDIDGFTVLGQIQIRPDSLNDFEAVFRVRNDTSNAKMAYFAMTLLKGQRIMATLDCSSAGSNVRPGSTTTVECTTTDNYQSGWTSVEVEWAGF